MYLIFLAIPLLVIIIFLILRLYVLFNTCERASEKNPGEKLPGCPSWTLTDQEEKEDLGERKDEK